MVSNYNPIFILFAVLSTSVFAVLAEEKIFRQQKYDHFQVNSVEYWDQRYLLIKSSSSQSPQKDLTNIIFLCSESGKEEDMLSCIPPYFDAQKRREDVNIILLEMRYHGKSQPFTSRYLSKDTLEFQTIQQNIADIATFIASLKKRNIIAESSTNILVGQQWNGSISTWAKMKYPHLIHGVIAFNSQLTNISYEQYNEQLDSILTEQNLSCKHTLQDFILYVNSQLQEQETAYKLYGEFYFKKRINKNIFQYYLYDMIQKQMETQSTISKFCSQINGKNYTQIIQHLKQYSTLEGRTLFDIADFEESREQSNQPDSNGKSSDQSENASNTLKPSLRLQCSDIGFTKFYSKQNNVNSRDFIFKSIPSLVFKDLCKTLFNQKYLPEEDRLLIENGGFEINHPQTLFINDMENINSFAFKNCTRESEFVDQNGGYSYQKDQVRNCISLSSTGQYISDYINYALYRWDQFQRNKINETNSIPTQSTQKEVEHNIKQKDSKEEINKDSQQKSQKKKNKSKKKVKFSKSKKNKQNKKFQSKDK